MGICGSGFEIPDENGIFFWMAGVCVMLKLCHVEQSFPRTYIYIIRCVQAMGCPVGIAGLDGRLDGWVWSRMFF